MFNVSIYYEDNPRPFKYEGISQIGYWSSGYNVIQENKILTHGFTPKFDYVLYSDTSCITISSKGLRCIEIVKA